MKYISLIFQNALKILLIFFLNYIWTRYFLKSLWLSLLVSAIATIVIDFILIYLGKKKNNSASLKIKEKEEAENMFLSLSTSENYLSFFLQLAKKENLNSIKKKKYILLDFSSHKTLFYPFMSMNEIKSDDIAKIYIEAQKEKVNKIVICCGDIGKDAITFSRSLQTEIILLDKFSTYKQLYKYYEFFPPITQTYKKNKKLAVKEILAYSFNRSRTKGYFISAIILFISTLYIRMNIYYTIMASTLIIFALLSYFNPYFNRPKSKIVLN